MKTKLSILLLICTTLLISLNGFGQKGVSGLVPSYIPDSLVWQCGPDADGYLDGKTLRIVGESLGNYLTADGYYVARSKPWDNVLTHGDVDTVIWDVKNYGIAASTHLTEGHYPANWNSPIKEVRLTSKVEHMADYNITGIYDNQGKVSIYVEEGLTTTGGSFTLLDDIFRITFPKSLSHIGWQFLYESKKIKHIILKNPVPPTLSTYAGYKEENVKDTRLWVPSGAKKDYQNSPHRGSYEFNKNIWLDFHSITEMINSDSINVASKYAGLDNKFPLEPLVDPLNANTQALTDWRVTGSDAAYIDNQTLIFNSDSLGVIFDLWATSWEGYTHTLKMRRMTENRIEQVIQISSMDADPVTFDFNTNRYETNLRVNEIFTPADPAAPIPNTLDMIKWFYDDSIFDMTNIFQPSLTIPLPSETKQLITPKVDTFGIFPLKATSWEGLTAETTIHLLSTNETITDIKVKHLGEDKEVSLNPDAANFHAQVHVPEDAEEVTVNPVPRHSVSTLRVRYLDAQGQWQLADDGVVKLDRSQHSVPVEIRVQSEHRLHQNTDDELGKFYELEVIPDPSTDARAGSLNVILIDSNGIESPSQLVPEFHPDVYEYELISGSLTNNIKQVRLEGSNYHPRAYKPDSTQIDIYEGENKIVLRVQAQHPDHHSEYTVKIWRISPPRLSRLTVEDTDVPLLPGQYKYEIQVPADQARVRVQAEAVETNHHVGGTGYINLSYGLQQIPITVTGLRNMKQIYRLNITREGAGQTDLPAGLSAIEQDFPVDVFTLTGIYLGNCRVSDIGRLKSHKVVIIKDTNQVIKVKL